MNFLKRNYKYFISPFIVLLLLIIVFLINDVYPFGSNTISNGDMGKAYSPIYYYMWDLFHGRANLFFNFKVGMGTNMYDLTSIYGIISPFSWLIALVDRSNIPNFLSYLLVLKVCFISITSFILFDKCYKRLDLFWKVFFSVIYAFSGWVIIYHTNLVWLDNVILFPLLILGMKRIVDDGNYRLYTVVLFLSLSLSYYISFMEILFVIFTSFGYLIFCCKKDDRRKVIFNLGVGTILAIGMSFVFIGPVIMQSFSSIRYNLNQEVLLFNATVDKLMIVLFYALPIILFLLLLRNKRFNKKYKRFLLYMFFVMCVGVIMDPINTMWHTGSYAAFPFRYGFMVVMVIYLGALYYLNINRKLEFKISRVSYCSIILLFGILIYLFVKYVPISKISNPSLYLSNKKLVFYVLVILMLSILLVVYLLWIKKIRVKYLFLSMFVIISIIGFSCGYIGIDSYKMRNEDRDVSLFKGNNLYDFLKDDENGFNSYKNLDNDLVSNYSFIIDKSSISSWHMVDKNSFKVLERLGYYVHFTEVRDNGGTLFSDNLLGINRYISSNLLDDKLYNLVKESDNYKLYELDSYLGYGFIYNKNDNDRFRDYNSSIEFQNNIYRFLFNKDDEILEDINVGVSDNKICSFVKGKEVIFNVRVDELSELYFYYDKLNYVGDKEFGDAVISYIMVNDEDFYNPNVNDSKNNIYTNSDGFIDLGMFENEDIEVIIGLSKDVCIEDFHFVSLDINKLNNLVIDYKSNVDIKQDGNKLLIDVENEDKGSSLFLPLNYLNGFEASLNGKEVNVDMVLNNFVSIDLEDGENEIILTYYPPYLKICFIISVIFLMLFLVLFKFDFVKVNKIMMNFFVISYYFICFCMFLFVFVIGFFKL